jgi:diaminopimelate decarboxylase
MNPFNYRNKRLHAEGVDLATIVQKVGTPCYVYSRAAIEERWRAFDGAFGRREHLVCYAVKANSNLAVLNVLARLGSGFDIVSGGELARVLAAGGRAERTVFSGVGKTEAEMEQALHAGILCFNVESEAELETLNKVAGRLRKIAPVSLRVNPDVDAATHPYISTGLRENKFGISIDHAVEVYRHARSLPHLAVRGADCHIGSQITTLAPFVEAVRRVLDLLGELADAGIELDHLDLGGGLGINYGAEEAAEPDDYVLALLDALQDYGQRYQRLRLLIEPGRAIVGNAGVLLTQVLHLKQNGTKRFAVIDAAMNDLIRPALYDAWHDIAPLAQNADRPRATYDVVGPVCESGDFLGRERELAITAGDMLAVASTGAYGFVMSSNYNTRGRAAEVMVDGQQFHVVRARETVEQLLAGESVLPGG